MSNIVHYEGPKMAKCDEYAGGNQYGPRFGVEVAWEPPKKVSERGW
ncbi:uncharacterized protein CLUP02_14750 [Colletotrichum lupini]|uniref:Uncharacterized protein n=1 Tax=Colletotrichum lupini TaxID=145971 RepID=A0A9Q8T6Q3_9PEZI|nr:uncharacterized protein CLUP02_14750 [Colletotrichum lupini]UQC89222.1 hypothetical protein CLUP02_14750 [Colletotrichum lupini]